MGCGVWTTKKKALVVALGNGKAKKAPIDSVHLIASLRAWSLPKLLSKQEFWGLPEPLTALVIAATDPALSKLGLGC
jgi:hypothetical protein